MNMLYILMDSAESCKSEGPVLSEADEHWENKLSAGKEVQNSPLTVSHLVSTSTGNVKTQGRRKCKQIVTKGDKHISTDVIGCLL